MMLFTEVVCLLLTFTVFLNCFVMYALRRRWLRASEERDGAWESFHVKEGALELTAKELSDLRDKFDRIRKHQQTILKLQTELSKLDNELGGSNAVATWVATRTVGDCEVHTIKVPTMRKKG